MPKAVAGAEPSNQWLALEQPPGPEPAAVPELVPEPVPEPVAEPEPAAAPAPEPGPAPPPVRANRQAWADHAVASGADPAGVDEMTKAQLIARYGAAEGE